MAVWVFLRGSRPGQQPHRLPEPGGIGGGFGLGDEADQPVGVLLREDMEDGIARLLGHAVGGAVPFFHPGGVEFEKGHFYRSFQDIYPFFIYYIPFMGYYSVIGSICQVPFCGWRDFVSISNKIRALMKLRGFKNKDLAAAIGSSAQSMNNKMYRDSFTAADLVRIVDALGGKLTVNFPDGEQLSFTMADLDEKKH